ncbi:MAG TPA: efflux transporter outer membrane subunit [Sphingomonas sp.]|jgi:multidrug efflux system outer membrane protein|nr:efflux transporter outer membrane subunit [Sphingomonas sp.]
MKRALIFFALLGGCSMEPKYVRPAPAIPATLPAGDTVTAPLDRRAIFRDPRLLALIERAIINNQNLRATLANVEVARGQYRVQRAAQLPAVDLGATAGLRKGTSSTQLANGSGSSSGSSVRQNYSVDLGINAFELDLFGRVRSLSNAALDEYLASDAGARAVRVTLVGDVAEAWFTYASDRSLLAIADDTRKAAEQSARLTEARRKGGIAPRSDLDQALTIQKTAEADYARQTAQVAQDRNALVLLLGGPVADAELAPTIDNALASITSPPVDISSEVLLRRPDVISAEYRLRAANARIGAARAAFFPRISLTGLLGFASNALGALFDGGSFNWSASGNLSQPIFDWGANKGNLTVARAGADAAVANYQNAIQTAFRETADALARRATLGDEEKAGRDLVAAAADNAYLADARYKGGVDTFLSSLDAQRSLYSARRSLVTTELARAANVANLYRALGGDAELPR